MLLVKVIVDLIVDYKKRGQFWVRSAGGVVSRERLYKDAESFGNQFRTLLSKYL